MLAIRRLIMVWLIEPLHREFSMLADYETHFARVLNWMESSQLRTMALP